VKINKSKVIAIIESRQPDYSVEFKETAPLDNSVTTISPIASRNVFCNCSLEIGEVVTRDRI
jgi:hypothetical protein